MKKLISFLLAITLLSGLIACRSNSDSNEPEENETSEVLQVEFGRESIMPEDPFSAHLGGGDPAKRVAQSIKDNVYITCVAFQQGDQTFLLYTMDTVNSDDSFTTSAKTAITQLTSVAADNILMCATHTHAGISIDTNWDGVDAYRRMFNEAAAYAGKAAMKDLAPAEVYHGNVQTEGLAFVRHYKLSDGSYAGSNFGNFANGPIIGHSKDAGETFQLVKFSRKEKKDIVMMNFPAHATFTTTSDTYISADYPSPTRQYIEANSDSMVAFFISAAGDQTPVSDIPNEAKFTRKQYAQYGEALGKYAVDALDQLTKSENITFKRSVQTYVGKSNKEKLELLPYASAVIAAGNEYGTVNSKTVAVAQKNGFTSYFEAAAVVNRTKTPATQSFDIQAMTIGDVGFVFAPYEMFNSQGAFIQENAACKTTFISTCSGGKWGYMPDALGFEIGCYESSITKFAPGIGEDLAQTFVDMLAQLNK